MAEQVRLPIDLDLIVVEPEVLLHESLGVQQMSAKDFAGGCVLVALHPRAGGHLPTALADAALQRLEHLGAVPFHEVVGRSLALREMEVRVLIHEPIDRAERVVRDADRFRPSPHPVHVDVRVADAVDGVLLGGFAEGGEDGFGLFDDGVDVDGAAGGGSRLNQLHGLKDQVLPGGLLFGPLAAASRLAKSISCLNRSSACAAPSAAALI